MRNQDLRWRTYPGLWEKLKPIAQEQRHEPTAAEKALWKYLRIRQLHGFIFRRQHPIGQFIVDFYCYKARLIIEVDGEIHKYRVEEDRVRQLYLESLGLKMLRFSNDSVLNNIQDVLRTIESDLPTIT
jgi:very-short-patch-repair endonuclease